MHTFLGHMKSILSSENSVSGCIPSVCQDASRRCIKMYLLVYRDVSGRFLCIGMYREGSIIVADMLYLADGYLPDSIYIPLQDHCNHLISAS